MLRLFTLFSLIFAVAHCSVQFYEPFANKEALNDWIQSTHHQEEERGSWSVSSSSTWEKDQYGLKTDQDSRFYGISKKIDKPFSNKAKTLVLQYMVKYEKSVSCGGAYIKLLSTDVDGTKFHGETPYHFMFGPDICGYSTKKVHAIFNYKGKNHLIKKDLTCKDDLMSHLYTFILNPDNTYKILIDNEAIADGVLEDDWDMLPPKQIPDPQSEKPADWVDDTEIVDETDKKPEDWDQPKTLPDPNAKKPEDWDDEMDGNWERPTIENPDYKGEWRPKMIANPAYKGPWEAPKIDNPEYKPDPDMYVMDNIGTVGFELWQVTAESIFDDILITDDVAFARAEGERLWKPRYELEMKKKNENDAKEREAQEKENQENEKSNEGDSNTEEQTEAEKESHEEL